MGNYYSYESPYGKIMIGSYDSAITFIKINGNHDPSGRNIANALTDKAARQLDEYFNGKRKYFDVPLNADGTDFQCRVWKALQDIPYGKTRSYIDIARAINNANASRAVGMANNKNPIWIMIPCHRVIGANGSLTGYGGGLEMKKKLLELEKITK